MKSPRWQISLSILVGVAWLAFILIWFFFYTDKYTWERHFAIVLMSLFIVCGLLGVPWLLWWLKHRTVEEVEMWNVPGFRWRVWVSCIIVFASLVVLIYWFWVYATPYRWYQNLIVFIVFCIIDGGIMAALWAPWGMKHPRKPTCDKKE